MPDTIKHVPIRKCIACNTRANQSDLLRITFNGTELKVDEVKKNEGRGCYLCKNSKCFENAIKKKAFQRTFKRAFSSDEIEKIGRYLNAK